MLEMASDVRIGGTVRSGEVKPSLNRAVMKTDARALTQGARGKPQLLEPPDADPHVRWCGRGEQATAPPIPIGAQPWLSIHILLSLTLVTHFWEDYALGD